MQLAFAAWVPLPHLHSFSNDDGDDGDDGDIDGGDGDGVFDDGDIAENDTFGAKYTMGSVTAAIQSTNVDYEAQASTDQDATHMGISMAINDDLTVSAGRQEVEFDGGTEDEVNTGIQASYTMGSISFSTAINSVESAGGTANKDAEASIFVASFAF